MDLLATVRKEGTRGGTGDFKWSDVQSSSHREHYLGHSLMAPVGRWQKNRDLNWYAKKDSKPNDDENPEQRAVRERKEEIRRIKEAEEDALARALGLPVPDRSNANLEALGSKKEVDKALKDAVEQDQDQSERGIGFGTTTSMDDQTQITGERIEGNAEAQDKEMQYALKEYKRRHGERHSRREGRSRSRSREPNRRHRRDRSADEPRERHRSYHGHRHRRPSSRERKEHRRQSPTRSTRSRVEDAGRNTNERDRKRSRSPTRRGYDNDYDRRRRG